jgi:uncharacterized protein YlxW (UPF0749 family)
LEDYASAAKPIDVRGPGVRITAECPNPIAAVVGDDEQYIWAGQFRAVDNLS